MTKLSWDAVGTRYFETGVDRGVLYIPDVAGAYVNGVAWNGLTTVTESPSGGEATPMYADNIKYLNMYSREEFGATIEAYTYPDEFAQFDGIASPVAGISVAQQSRKGFGLSYRSQVGNDLVGTDFGYKLHLVYGCMASPSEKAHSTINDSPEAITFSWALSTTPVAVNGLKPTSILTIDSTKVNATALANLETLLYGTVGVDPALPLPDVVLALFTGTVTTVTPTQPTYNSTTKVITIPTVAGVSYYLNGVLRAPGTVTITADAVVEARPNSGYIFPETVDDDWFFDF